MIKKLLTLFLPYVTCAAFACSHALPVDDPQFCSSFKMAATCYCTASGLPFGMCQDMHILYNRMNVVFKSLEKACAHQTHTTPQDCIDNWRCYLAGGSTPQGQLCSSTGYPCE